MPRRKATTKKKKVDKSAQVNNKADKKKKETKVVLSFEEQEKVEKEKNFAMWAGVIFFMVIIVSVWIFNFKQNITTVNENQDNSTNELQDIFKNFDEMMDEAKTSFDELSEAVEEVNNQDKELDGQTVQEGIELEKFLYKINEELQQEQITE